MSEMLTSPLMCRPVLCDLLSAQGAVLEHNISTEVGVRHKRHARHAMQNLADIVERHLHELGGNNAAALVETTLLMTVAAWQCTARPRQCRPSTPPTPNSPPCV
jgi:hypothetical protein